MTQAPRKRPWLCVAPATRAGVRKMPMPITRLTTTIAVSMTDSLASGPDAEPCSARTKSLPEQGCKRAVLVFMVVELRRNADDLPARAGPWEEPGLDAALMRPGGQGILVEPRNRRAALGGRKGDRGHRAEHRRRAWRLEVKRFKKDLAPLQREVMISLHQGRPSPGDQAAEITQALGDRKPWCRVGGPDPVPLPPEADPAARRVVSMAHHQRPHPVSQVLAHMDERGPLRRAEPLVRVARVAAVSYTHLTLPT